MSILIDERTRVIVQGFTGEKATFHAREMIAYGTNVVGGVTPGKGGTRHLDRPVFNTAEILRSMAVYALKIFIIINLVTLVFLRCKAGKSNRDILIVF